jgi:hypothetical protein
MIYAGFKVRMHGYEYFVRDRNFVAIIVLNPLWNSARVYEIPWNLEESRVAINVILGLIREIDPRISIEVVENYSRR